MPSSPRHRPGGSAVASASGSKAWTPWTEAAAIARELKLPAASFDLLRDEAIACLALPDLKTTGRVISQPPEVILSRVRFHNDPLCAPVPRWDDQGSPRRPTTAKSPTFKARGDREIFVFRFSPDGRYLATTHFPGHALTVWNVDNGDVALSEPGPDRWDGS